jgi:hypothetical protein
MGKLMALMVLVQMVESHSLMGVKVVLELQVAQVMVEKVDLAVAAVVGIIHFAAQAAPVVIAEVKGELGQV